MKTPDPDFGDTVTGYAADPDDWTGAGPRVLRPRRTVTGTVVGLFATSAKGARVQLRSGEVVCVRVLACTRPRQQTPLSNCYQIAPDLHLHRLHRCLCLPCTPLDLH